MIIDIDMNKCTSCRICDPVCPADVIHMELRDGRDTPIIKYIEHCITCFNCEIFCPENCIDVHPLVKRRPLPW